MHFLKFNNFTDRNELSSNLPYLVNSGKASVQLNDCIFDFLVPPMNLKLSKKHHTKCSKGPVLIRHYILETRMIMCLFLWWMGTAESDMRQSNFPVINAKQGVTERSI